MHRDSLEDGDLESQATLKGILRLMLSARFQVTTLRISTDQTSACLCLRGHLTFIDVKNIYKSFVKADYDIVRAFATV